MDFAKQFPPREELPPPGSGLPGTGLGNSPRRSDGDTAIILSPEDYETLRALAGKFLQVANTSSIVPVDSREGQLLTAYRKTGFK